MEENKTNPAERIAACVIRLQTLTNVLLRHEMLRSAHELELICVELVNINSEIATLAQQSAIELRGSITGDNLGYPK